MVVKVPVIAVKVSLCGRIAWGCCHHVCCCCCCFVVAIVCCCCCCFVVCCFLRNSYGSRFLKLPHWTVTALTVLANLIIYCLNSALNSSFFFAYIRILSLNFLNKKVSCSIILIFSSFSASFSTAQPQRHGNSTFISVQESWATKKSLLDQEWLRMLVVADDSNTHGWVDDNNTVCLCNNTVLTEKLPLQQYSFYGLPLLVHILYKCPLLV